MTIDCSSPEMVFALRVVRQASALARHIREEVGTTSLTKSDLSPVTVADFAIQALVAHALESAFPSDSLVAEERSEELRQSESLWAAVTRFVKVHVPDADPGAVCRWIDRGAGAPGGRFWTLDPIDGTKGYLRGGQYAVALALLENGHVQIGVLGCPNLGEGVELAAAARERGAWGTRLSGDVPFQRIEVSARANPAEARVLRSFEAAHTNVSALDAIVKRLGVRADPVLMDSQAKYAMLASGAGDLILRPVPDRNPDYQEKIWDHAAGSIIVEEAHGRVTDLDGRPLDFNAGRTLARNRGMVSSNGHIHEAVLEVLRELNDPA